MYIVLWGVVCFSTVGRMEGIVFPNPDATFVKELWVILPLSPLSIVSFPPSLPPYLSLSPFLSSSLSLPSSFPLLHCLLHLLSNNSVSRSFRGLPSSENLAGSGVSLSSVFHVIKELQTKFRAREQEKKELEGYKEQDTLILSTTKGNPRLKDLYMKPLIGSRKVQVAVQSV